MIKSTELRIGNWIRDVHSERGAWEVKQLTTKVCYYGDYRSFYRNLEPIPLTEEWLKMFGFEKRESSTCNAWYIGKNEITHDWLFDIVWLHRPELINAPNFPFYRNGRHLIKHVHQLQNLYFALTNEELTITQ